MVSHLSMVLVYMKMCVNVRTLGKQEEEEAAGRD
jgi:hypothetical protein